MESGGEREAIATLLLHGDLPWRCLISGCEGGFRWALKLPAVIRLGEQVDLLLGRHWVVCGSPEQDIAYGHPRNKNHCERAPAFAHQLQHDHPVPIMHHPFGPPALLPFLVSAHSKTEACGFL